MALSFTVKVLADPQLTADRTSSSSSLGSSLEDSVTSELSLGVGWEESIGTDSPTAPNLRFRGSGVFG